jgi:hypothetical protein
LRKFKKVYLKANIKCLKNENAGTISGPCPDSVALLKIQARPMPSTPQSRQNARRPISPR